MVVNHDENDIRITRASDLLAIETRRFKQSFYECAQKVLSTTSNKVVYQKVAEA